MLDAIVGAVVVVMATTALVVAIEVAEQSLNNAGRQPLNSAEMELLQQAGRSDPASLNQLQADLDSLPQQ